MDYTCADCRFWDRYFDTALTGRCRFNAPPIIVGVDSHNAEVDGWAWPSTNETEWCGQFQSIPQFEEAEEDEEDENPMGTL